MMNFLALGLLISSLAAAGVWSPLPDPKPHDHVVREGHRLIVVEYERQVPSDTSSPSPPPPSTTHQLIEEAKDKFHDAASLLPNVGQGISTPQSNEEQPTPAVHSHSPKEMICDAYGACKEKLSSLLGKGKDHISEKASELEESTKDTVKNTVDAMRGKASKLEESTKDAVKKTVDVARDAGEDVVGNLSRVAGKAVDRAEEVAGVLQRNLTDILRRARDVAYDAARYVGAPETARAAAAVAHLLAFAVAYGTCVWVTFVSSHVLATALPRQQFGMVQSKLYPVYFRAVAYGVGVAFLAHFFGRGRLVGPERMQAYNLLTALGLVLVNMLYLEPKATKVMFERMKMEKEEGRGRDMAEVIAEPVVTTTSTAQTTATTQSTTSTFGATRTTVTMNQEAIKSRVAKLNKRLKKLNTYSSFLNILTLMGLTWHLVHLAHLQMTC